MNTTGAAFYSVASVEEYRFVADGKQQRAANEIVYRIGEVQPLTLTSLYPVGERRFDIIPWAYKPATDAQIANGTYRTVRKDGVTYYLATNKDGNARPRTLTGKQLVQLVSDAMADAAATILRDNDMVGLHVTFSPVVDWSAESRTARKGASNGATNRKNRHGRNDAKAAAAKAARASKRAAARK